MKSWRAILVSAVAVGAMVLASSAAAQESKAAASKAGDSPAAHEATAGREYSGMYSCLKDGEFVQVTVEDAGRVTGFVSRYGGGERENGALLDQYFRSGKLDGHQLSSTTETLHAVWFEFRGTVE